MKTNLGLAILGQYFRHTPIETAKWRIGSLLRKMLAAKPARATVRVVGGSLMDLDTSEFLQRELYVQRELEPAIRSEITKRLKLGDTFLDIGANVGFFTLIAAKAVGPNGRVYSFEPVPKTRDMLARNVRLNGLKNVVAVPVALSDETGQSKIFLDATNNSGAASLRRSPKSGDAISIEIDTYDRLASVNSIPTPALIKMDIEGAETKALKGMANLLSRPNRPVVILEVSEWGLENIGSSKDELFNLMVSYRYKAKLLSQPIVSIYSGQKLYFQYDVLFEPIN